jgi:hypothetical protein
MTKSISVVFAAMLLSVTWCRKRRFAHATLLHHYLTSASSLILSVQQGEQQCCYMVHKAVLQSTVQVGCVGAKNNADGAAACSSRCSQLHNTRTTAGVALQPYGTALSPRKPLHNAIAGVGVGSKAYICSAHRACCSIKPQIELYSHSMQPAVTHSAHAVLAKATRCRQHHAVHHRSAAVHSAPQQLAVLNCSAWRIPGCVRVHAARLTEVQQQHGHASRTPCLKDAMPLLNSYAQPLCLSPGSITDITSLGYR